MGVGSESLLGKKWSHILIKSSGLKIFQIYVMMEIKVSVLGVVKFLCDCTFILADLGS